MAREITMYTKYPTDRDHGGRLEVSKFSVKKRGRKTSENKWQMYVSFEGKEITVKKAWIYLDPELAIPLARNLLSVAEGYVSESVSEVA